jgi:serine/threonine protein kinase
VNHLAKAARSGVASTTTRPRLIADVAAAVAELRRLWALGAEPQIDVLWARFSPGHAVEVLAALAKADIQARFDRGERPEAATYLERFATLRDDRDRVVSLVYEEFCLREERGERPEPDAFCDRYEPWRDSLLAQLCCHDMLSQAIGGATPARPLPMSGDRFRSFRLGAILGQGGSARVFLAHDESLGDRRVALKVSTDRGKEPAIQGRLDHAHIVPVLSVTDDPETGFRGLCMPYRAGLPLDEVIRRVDPANRPRRAGVLRQVLAGAPESDIPEGASDANWRGFPDRGSYAEGVAWVVGVVARALAHAHGRGVFHRDVKPANVLLATREGPQLLDFNLSHAPHDATHAEAALRGGTLPYMAPEQLAAFLDPNAWDAVGERADIYSLGLLLRELLTGERPDSPDLSVPLPRAICDLLDRRSLGFAPARSVNPDVPHALEAILARCLAPRPDDRYSSARALAEDLERFVARRPLVEASNPSRIERARNWASRRHIGRAAIIAVGLLAFGFAATLLTSGEEPSDAGSHVAVAMTYVSRNQTKEALAELAKAEKLDPGLYTIYQLRAKVLNGSDERQAALVEINRAIRCVLASKSRPGDDKIALIYLDQAVLLRQEQQIDEAKAAYSQALALSPTCHTAHSGLGIIANDIESRYLEARKHFAAAIPLAKATNAAFSTAALYARYDIVAQTRLASESEKANDLVLAKRQFSAAMDDIQLLRAEFDSHANDDAEKLRPAEVRARTEESALLYLAEGRVRIALATFAARADDFAASVDGFEKARDSLRKAGELGAPDVLVQELDKNAQDGLQKVQKLLSH